MDVAHCGGILTAKKIAAMAAVQDLRIAPHCSIGPVALAACLHVDVSTPNFMIQEAFAEFDVPWRNSFVKGWNPIRNGEFFLSEEPGLGLDIDEEAIRRGEMAACFDLKAVEPWAHLRENRPPVDFAAPHRFARRPARDDPQPRSFGETEA